jgi:hypothetical protein
MAHCVISPIVDADDMVVAEACMVHAHWAPCPRDGEPAAPLSLHALGTTREDALNSWQIRTDRQRPLVIHRDDGRPIDAHTSDDGDHCSCGPEIIPAEQDAANGD